MTRFARAKGSKSSNERIPNEATPWHVMKDQLEMNAATKNNTPKAKSAKELLKEKEDLFYYDSVGNLNNEWAEFDCPKAAKTAGKKDSVKAKITPKSEKKTKKKLISTATENVDCATEATVEKTVSSPKKESKKRKSDKLEHPEPIDNAETSGTTEVKRKKKKSEKPVEKKEIKIDKVAKETKMIVEKPGETGEAKIAESESKWTSTKVSKRHKRNQKRLTKKALEKASTEAAANGVKPEVPVSGGFNVEGNDWSSNVAFGKRRTFEQSNNTAKSEQQSTANSEAPRYEKQSNFGKPPQKKRKPPKIRDDKEHKRRKPDTGVTKCIINGIEVEITKYDGFPVKKEDAERLKELRQKMIMKAIPKSEIDAAMKLERRKAEKALARIRKQVCFHCRKAGHNLSDCPELGKEESATGICFKCGSTEHTHFECRVTKKEEFRFASCFICREQGHIAKQCPDNPKGLYPQGGACKICGDVTHLKKDCPDLTKEKEETTMTLGTISADTIESLDEEATGKKTAGDKNKKTKRKIVNF